jgi:hypothetical protein
LRIDYIVITVDSVISLIELSGTVNKVFPVLASTMMFPLFKGAVAGWHRELMVFGNRPSPSRTLPETSNHQQASSIKHQASRYG